jgi:hypothetical protein
MSQAPFWSALALQQEKNMKTFGTRSALRDHARESTDLQEVAAYVRVTNWDRIADCASIRAATLCPEPEHPMPGKPALGSTKTALVQTIRAMRDSEQAHHASEVQRFETLASTAANPKVQQLYLDLAEQMRRRETFLKAAGIQVAKLNKPEAAIVVAKLRTSPSLDQGPTFEQRKGRLVLHYGSR